MAIEEKKSNIVATEQIAATLEQVTGEVTKPDTNAEPSAEQTIPKPLLPEVEAAHVVIHTDQGITKLNDAAEGLGGRVSGPEVNAGSVDGSGVTFASTKKTLEDQAIEARSKAAKGSAESGKKWGGLARFIAGARKRFQHQQIEALPDNVTPISQAKSFGNPRQQEQITGPTLIASAEQELPKAT